MIRILTLFFLLLPNLCFAQSTLFSGELNQSIKAVSYDLKSNDWYAENTLVIENGSDASRFTFDIEGKGRYDQYKDVAWSKQAEVQWQDNMLVPLSSDMRIRGIDGNEAYSYHYTYDYGSSQLTYAFRIDGVTERKRTYKLKGPTTDEVTMVQFLRPYVPFAGQEGYDSFYLLAKAPSLYKVNIIPQGEDVLTFGDRHVHTIKIQLKADLGPLTNIMAAIVPPTYLWYESQYPYRWVKYQGVDSGQHAPVIRASVYYE